MRHAWPVALVCLLSAACIQQRCTRNAECESPRVCTAGECVWQCDDRRPCGQGLDCVDHVCRPGGRDGGPEAADAVEALPDRVPEGPEAPDRPPDGLDGADATDRPEAGDRPEPADAPVPDGSDGTPPPCPEEMALAGGTCIDRWEASRPDATAIAPGTDGSRAQSRPGVLPWQVPDNATAQAACAAAGKRLCSPAEWAVACHGPAGTAYSYGDVYDPAACNGIDTFGPGGYHLAPTGSFPRCTNGFGIFDANGNLWEHVLGGDDTTVRGGAYNCLDSVAYHRCDYVPGWAPAAKGFRCCRDPR